MTRKLIAREPYKKMEINDRCQIQVWSKGYAGVLPKNVIGMTYHLELALRFAEWAEGMLAPPTAEQISSYFNVSRATGYRWQAAWLAAKGISP
jgi:hypothetical protein